MSPRSASRLAAAACGLLLLLGSLPGGARPLVVATSRGPVSLPLYVADSQGFFKAEGVDVQLRDCPSGRACARLVEDGAADVATAAELVATLDAAVRPDLVIIATVSTSSRHIKLVARRSAGIEDARQLTGKRIGTVAGTSAQYFLDTWLIFNGIDRAGVTEVPLPPEQLAGALQRHDVDAVAIWEPEAALAAGALAEDALVMPASRVYTQHFCLLTSRASVAARAGEFQRMLRALIRAQQGIASDPAAARALLRRRFSGPEPRPDATIDEHDFRIRLDQSLLSTMESEARWAGRVGLGDPRARRANVLELIDTSLLKAVAPAAVGLAQ